MLAAALVFLPISFRLAGGPATRWGRLAFVALSLASTVLLGCETIIGLQSYSLCGPEGAGGCGAGGGAPDAAGG
jgi:hypothetical protein